MLRRIPVIVVLGSTGTGKTKLSIELAEKFGGEIISADSMQVYPNLDIVTAKATRQERAMIKHHLLDVANPKEPYTVLHYRDTALPIMNDLLTKEKLPIIVGGTNYYIESLLWDILVSRPPLLSSLSSSTITTTTASSSPASTSSTASTTKISTSSSSSKLMSMTQTSEPENIFVAAVAADDTSQDSKIIELELEKLPSNVLHDRLRQIDPVTAGKLHPNNRRKIIRALEVFHEKGVPLSSIIEEQRNKPGGNRLGGPLRYPHTIILWLHCNQEVLNERLEKRINSMLQKGLISELRNFYEKYVKDTDKQTTKGILQTIGLKEFLPYLEKYDLTTDEILENYLKSISYNLSDSSLNSNEPESFNLFRNCLNELKNVTIRYSKKQIKWIKNRFLGYKDRQVPELYKLDTSNIDLWKENVYDPAIDIIESYMNDSKSKLNPVEKILHPSFGLNEEILNVCVVCKRHFVGEYQWKLHLKSNKHKRAKESLRNKIKMKKGSSDKK